MSYFHIEYDDKDYRRLLDRLRDHMGEINTRIVLAIATEAARRVKDRLRNGGGGGMASFLDVRSGFLWQSVDSRKLDEETYEVFVGAIYGAIHEYGGDIYPVNAQFLHFQINGEDIFTKHVWIPPRPYFHPTVQEYFESEEMPALIVRILQAEFDKAAA